MFRCVKTKMKKFFWKKIHSLRKKLPIMVQYTPPEGLNSAEVWLLLYRRSDPISIISLIYKWLWDWLISINTKEKEFHNPDKNTIYIVHKIKDLPEISPLYECLFWESLFSSWNDIELDSESDLNFEETLKLLEESWYKKWWFTKSNWLSNQSLIVIIMIITLMVLLLIAPNNDENKEFMTMIILILFAIFFLFPKLWIIVGIELPKHKKIKTTEKWDNLIYHILWFKNFLETCDTKILRTFLKKDPLYFDKVLPYAIIFWIESELIEKFRPLMDEFGLKLYIYQFKNPLYNTLHHIAEHSIPIKTWNTKIIDSNWGTSYDSDTWFSSGSSFSWWWGGFSSGWGWGGGGSRSR